MRRLRISIRQEKLAEFCRQHHIQKLSFFGFVLRDDFRGDSDIDVLVEFEPGYVPGLAFFGMEEEFSEILGGKVVLHTPKFLRSSIRKKAMEEAEVQYIAI
jgi:hypothetical protein